MSPFYSHVPLSIVLRYFYSILHLIKSPAREQRKKKKKRTNPFKAMWNYFWIRCKFSPIVHKLLCEAFLWWVLRQGQKCYLYNVMKLYGRKPVRETLCHWSKLSFQWQNSLGKCLLATAWEPVTQRNRSLEDKAGAGGGDEGRLYGLCSHHTHTHRPRG